MRYIEDMGAGHATGVEGAVSPVEFESAAILQRACPRCGYDLTGTIDSWRDECPMHGTCSECGLTFSWGDIFNDAAFEPRWSFEHGRWSLGRLAWSFLLVGTSSQAWGRLRMDRPVRPERLALFAIVVLALGYAVPGVVYGVAEARWSMFFAFPERTIGDLGFAFFHAFARESPAFEGRGVLVVIWAALHWLCVPLLLLILDETFRRYKVRRVHILRGAAYSLAPLAIVVGFSWLLSFVSVMVSAAVGVPLTLLLISAACARWWWGFIGDYLRLRAAWWVTGVLMGVTLLASVTLGLWLSMAVLD
jgi:hypothetical protein